MARYSEAHNRAHKKWINEKKYRVNSYFPIEWKDDILNRVADFSSANAYINYLVKQDLGLSDVPEE